MQSKLSLLAVVFSLFLSSSRATTSTTAYPLGEDEIVPPKPLSVVSPARAPAGYENATVKLELTVDAQGRPQHVDTLGLLPTEAQELIIGAVKKWIFAPATRHGVPVSVRIILPLKLAVSEN